MCLEFESVDKFSLKISYCSRKFSFCRREKFHKASVFALLFFENTKRIFTVQNILVQDLFLKTEVISYVTACVYFHLSFEIFLVK